MLEWVLKLPDIGIKEAVCADGCPVDTLILGFQHQAHDDLSTTAGGLNLISPAGRRFAVAVGSVCKASPAVLTSLTGPLGDSMLANPAALSYFRD